MIVGVGVDLTEIGRVQVLLERWGERFERRVFTEGERAYAKGRVRRAQHFAARFAAKEATLKALGVPEGASFHDMEVIMDGGAPRLVLSGVVGTCAQGLGVSRTHLSLTHSLDLACAVVVLERD